MIWLDELFIKTSIGNININICTYYLSLIYLSIYRSKSSSIQTMPIKTT